MLYVCIILHTRKNNVMCEIAQDLYFAKDWKMLINYLLAHKYFFSQVIDFINFSSN